MGSFRDLAQFTKGWTAILKSTKTILSFFVLVLLIVEGGLIFLAAHADAKTLLLLVAMMVLVMLAAIAAVVVLTIVAPGELTASPGTFDPAKQSAQRFFRSIEGNWWEFLNPEHDGAAFSSVEIRCNRATGTVSLHGNSYFRPGSAPPDRHRSATWHGTVSSWNEWTIFYSWTGEKTSDASGFAGFGEVAFDPGGQSAGGSFIEVNLTNLQALRRTITLRRIEPKELRLQKTLPFEEFAAAILASRDSIP